MLQFLSSAEQAAVPRWSRRGSLQLALTRRRRARREPHLADAHREAIRSYLADAQRERLELRRLEVSLSGGQCRSG
jgi:hypothetical protein